MELGDAFSGAGLCDATGKESREGGEQEEEEPGDSGSGHAWDELDSATLALPQRGKTRLAPELVDIGTPASSAGYDSEMETGRRSAER